MEQKTYRVAWLIEIDAESAEDAATVALMTQTDPGSGATLFHVVAPDGQVSCIDAASGATREPGLGREWEPLFFAGK